MGQRSHWDRVRNRIEQLTDQARSIPQLWRPPARAAEGDGVAVLAVSFNTLALTKLMLLTLAEARCPEIRRVVVVDNGSVDGSADFLAGLRASAVELVRHRGPATHGAGLRRGMDHIRATDALFPARRTGLVLLLDSDVIVLKSTLCARLTQACQPADVAAAGELQFDVGEPYAHPCCLMVRRSCYESRGIWPFVHHGAPALFFQRSARARGRRVVDVPVRKEDYIVHRGQGTLETLAQFAPGHPNRWGRYHAHYDGNPRGETLWQRAEQRHAERLQIGNQPAAIAYIAERFPPLAEAVP